MNEYGADVWRLSNQQMCAMPPYSTFDGCQEVNCKPHLAHQRWTFDGKAELHPFQTTLVPIGWPNTDETFEWSGRAQNQESIRGAATASVSSDLVTRRNIHDETEAKHRWKLDLISKKQVQTYRKWPKIKHVATPSVTPNVSALTLSICF